MGLKATITNLLIFCDKNSPTILAGLGMVGTVATGLSSYKAGIRAHDIITRHHEDMEMVDEDDKEAKRAVMGETVKELIPVLVPPILIGSFTVTAIFMSNKINSKRIAVLGTAYALSEKRLKEYENKMQEVLGEQKTQNIRESIAHDKVVHAKVPADMQEMALYSNQVITIDDYTGRMFLSSAEAIGLAVNKLTDRVRDEMYIPLNDLYEEVGLGRVPLGDDLGWNIDDCINGKLPIFYTAVLNDNGHPCLSMEYDVNARRDFRELSR